MALIKLPAARVRQGALVLYATAMKVRDLVRENFYSVETLDPDDSDAKGYQRVLNKARAKKLADYIVKGQDIRNGGTKARQLAFSMLVRSMLFRKNSPRP
ncbi:hypothetical protein JQ617_33895 [Bradyrhizobium sp. KB893862 SZCCT0404]|uniref:DNA sulfur modification protein DndB n=1 Tax=Bradyrhizobium sp. KB893862 SZCCT0404 TaxID=2807672 RepID=UPI001BABCD6D|nr:DNA sulfur modification protein DndB [Bradyrhizobium sp. KB893862 SZCCT0404]MBR1179000.1 hypothetical protein [Bradyrhizobium sp. KB893862 SZCCT0404]